MKIENCNNNQNKADNEEKLIGYNRYFTVEEINEIKRRHINALNGYELPLNEAFKIIRES
jgi:hypothetical protein